MDTAETFLFADEEENEPLIFEQPWKVLVVDDDESIHQMTQLALNEFEFDNRKLKLISAYSASEAIAIIEQQSDIALILLDVIMETEHAGFDVIKHIRNTMKHPLVRIIVRTGQPGSVSAHEIIREYDISDYKSKVDLSNLRLFTSVISGLRSYKELERVESNKQALYKLVQINDNLIDCKTIPELIQQCLRELENKLPFIQVFNRQPTSSLFVGCKGSSYNILAANGVFTEQLKNQYLDDDTQTLIFNAIEEKKIQQFQQLSAVPIETRSYQGELVLLTDNPEMKNGMECRIYRLLAHNLSATIDNLYHINNLELNKSQLEAKVTRRTHEIEEEKFKAEFANKAKSTFLSNMSHEIRTPMNAILGYTQLLKNNDNIPVAEQSELKKIEKSAYHLLALINDVLDISKIEAGKMEIHNKAFYLHDLISDIETIFALQCQKKNLKLTINSAIDELVVVKGDHGKLTQILTNVVGNAIKFTDSGEVTLSITPQEDNHYLFEVQDSGKGINDTDIEHLFEAFEQGNEGSIKGGTGLGLSISSRYINMMGGELKIDTTVGLGSRFYFTLELLSSPDTELPDSDKKFDIIYLKPEYKLNVLIVDDVKINIAILSKVLKRTGVNVYTAVNGLEAIEQVKNSNIDFIFMDVLMPVMNGDEAIRIIRKKHSAKLLPCAAVTAFSMKEEIDHFIEAGFNLYVSKPYKFSAIYNCLTTFYPERFFKEVKTAVIEKDFSTKVSLELIREKLTSEHLQKIITAAQLNKLSVLKKLFEQIMQAIPETVPFFLELQSLLDNYDTDGIISRIKEITNEHN